MAASEASKPGDKRASSNGAEALAVPAKVPKLASSYQEHLKQYYFNSSLPAELNDQFTEKECKLCGFNLKNAAELKAHYPSKNHTKRVRNWMTAYCEKNNVPMPSQLSVLNNIPELNSATEPDSSDGDDTKFKRCVICQVSFNSKMHANNHYGGKKHARKLLANKVRLAASGDMGDNRAGIGQSFANASLPQGCELNEVASVFECKICDVTAVNAEQFKAHTGGSKHAKALKMHDELLEMAETYKNYRTPSDRYVCACCDIALPGVQNFHQHMTSKKHLKKAPTARKASVLDYNSYTT